MAAIKFTLRHLEAFLAVARDESISKAAAALSMSQSATSAALQELEHRYDTQLFERAGKRLYLNSRGKHMRAKAEVLMREVLAFEHELTGIEDRGDLRVGASLTIGNYLAVGFLTRYLQEMPEADVDLQVGSTPEIVAKVLNFELDLGLVEADVHHPDLSLTFWRDDRMLIICSPSHPLASKNRVVDKDLLAARWVLREPESGARQTFDRAMQGILPHLDIALELRHNEAIKSAVKSGLGLGCLSEIAVREELARGTLVALKPEKRDMQRRFYFVTHRQIERPEAVQRWVDICLSDPEVTAVPAVAVN